ANSVSLSWGGSTFSQLEQDVVDYAWGMGTIIVAAAGNGESTTRHFPAAYNHVLSVAATQIENDELARFSSFGSWVNICAPGIGILSTLPNDSYAFFSGTSMCTPMVAGAIALIKARFPTDAPHDILLHLVAGADNIDDVNADKAGLLGYGRLNVLQALTGPTTAPDPILTMTPSFSDEDGDGIAEPGETVELTVALENQFLGGPAANLSLVLRSDDYAVQLLTSQVTLNSTIEPLTGASTPVPFTFSIAATAIPHRAVFTLEVTGANGYADTFTFSTPIGRAPILLVDDDDGGNNVESYYFDSLDSLGMLFTYWSHIDQGTPADILANYSTVIWFTEWAFPALDAVDRAALGTYLGGGGRLFLSGQDIGWDLSDPTGTQFLESSGVSQAWYENNLHARYIADDATPNGGSNIKVTGISGNAIGDGLSFIINQPGLPPEFQFPSVIEPLTGAQAIFHYPDDRTAATLWSGAHRVVNFAFGFEAITDPHARFVIMDRVVEWLNDLTIRHTPSAGTSSATQGVEIVADVETSSQIVDSIAIYWSLDGAAPFQIEVMTNLTGSRTYRGVIPAQNRGSTVYYFIFAMNKRNFYQTSPQGAPRNMHSYHVGPDIVLWEDFESGLDIWSIEAGWDLISPGHTGAFAITESPAGSYDNDQEYILETREGVNLNSRELVFLSFWHQYDVGLGDTAFVELTRDNVSWSVAKTFTGDKVWEQVYIPLSSYAGTEDIRFRFRFKSDGEHTADGWTIDDITLQLDTVVTVAPIQSFALMQNYPNPFNLTTVIEYHLPREGDVSLTVYNIRGQVVRRLLKEHRSAGIHTFTLNVSGLASGIYIYRLEATGFSRARKMVLLK
ncbi:MAG: S8 family serine peptidase, partial [Candidatus Marinimicrobia bacterium]|nr:S8 family serine peptidase [Candidatus Neomarinimicrobiota bacterium]